MRELAMARLAQSGVGCQREGLERQVEISHDRMVKKLDADGMDPDVVRGPPDPELVTAGGPGPKGMPGGSRFELKWDGFLH